MSKKLKLGEFLQLTPERENYLIRTVAEIVMETFKPGTNPTETIAEIVKTIPDLTSSEGLWIGLKLGQMLEAGGIPESHYKELKRRYETEN